MMTKGRYGLGLIQSCSFEGNLGHLWLASGCSRDGEKNYTAPQEEVEACAHV